MEVREHAGAHQRRHPAKSRQADGDSEKESAPNGIVSQRPATELQGVDNHAVG